MSSLQLLAAEGFVEDLRELGVTEVREAVSTGDIYVFLRGEIPDADVQFVHERARAAWPFRRVVLAVRTPRAGQPDWLRTEDSGEVVLPTSALNENGGRGEEPAA